MPKNPIYIPTGAALEYADYALNLYTECSHGCTYCYARDMAKRFGNPWTDGVRPREGIIEDTEKQLAKGKLVGKTIHLCFTCDPYPRGCDCSTTTEVIRLIKKYGANVQILTKGKVSHAMQDFEYLNANDCFGITLTGNEKEEPNATSESKRMIALDFAKLKNIKTFVSCEPVLNTKVVMDYIQTTDTVDQWLIGKLNNRKSDIDWHRFGHEVEALCKKLGRNYYIKESLRAEMQKIKCNDCGKDAIHRYIIGSPSSLGGNICTNYAKDLCLKCAADYQYKRIVIGEEKKALDDAVPRSIYEQ